MKFMMSAYSKTDRQGNLREGTELSAEKLAIARGAYSSPFAIRLGARRCTNASPASRAGHPAHLRNAQIGSNGTTQSRPFPARAVKRVESAWAYMKKGSQTRALTTGKKAPANSVTAGETAPL